MVPADARIIELNNLLSVLNIKDISIDKVDEVSKKYKVNLYKEISNENLLRFLVMLGEKGVFLKQ